MQNDLPEHHFSTRGMASHPRILIFHGLLLSNVGMLKLAFDVLPHILGATDQTYLSNQEV
jgi:hypothetical protein